MKGKGSNKGSLTVEATLIITIFIFGYLSIITISDFIRAQMIIQYSITQAAKEISSYCYIISKTGLMADSQRLGQEAGKEKKKIDDVIDSVVKLYDAVENGTDHITNSIREVPIDAQWFEKMEAWNNTGEISKEEFNHMMSAAESMMDKSENYFSNPDEILKGLGTIVKDEAFKQIKSYALAAPISKALVKKQIELYGKDQRGDDVLKHLGVVDGLDGLKFTGSTLFNDGKTIEITVTYKMKVEVPFFEKKEFYFRQTAVTEAWGSKNEKRPWRK